MDSEALANDFPDAYLAGSGSPNRVVLVEEDEHVRGLVRPAVASQPDFMMVAEVTDGPAVAEAVSAHQPDFVLLDVALLVVNGQDTLQVIAQLCPDALVVV